MFGALKGNITSGGAINEERNRVRKQLYSHESRESLNIVSGSGAEALPHTHANAAYRFEQPDPDMTFRYVSCVYRFLVSVISSWLRGTLMDIFQTVLPS